MPMPPAPRRCSRRYGPRRSNGSGPRRGAGRPGRRARARPCAAARPRRRTARGERRGTSSTSPPRPRRRRSMNRSMARSSGVRSSMTAGESTLGRTIDPACARGCPLVRWRRSTSQASRPSSIGRQLTEPGELAPRRSAARRRRTKNSTAPATSTTAGQRFWTADAAAAERSFPSVAQPSKPDSRPLSATARTSLRPAGASAGNAASTAASIAVSSCRVRSVRTPARSTPRARRSSSICVCTRAAVSSAPSTAAQSRSGAWQSGSPLPSPGLERAASQRPRRGPARGASPTSPLPLRPRGPGRWGRAAPGPSERAPRHRARTRARPPRALCACRR